MCGSGAAMIEAAYSHGCIALGGDVDVTLRATLLETTSHAAIMSTGIAKAEVQKNKSMMYVCMYCIYNCISPKHRYERMNVVFECTHICIKIYRMSMYSMFEYLQYVCV